MCLLSDPFAGVSHKFSAAAGGVEWVNPAAFNGNDPSAVSIRGQASPALSLGTSFMDRDTDP
jgi:hypothetical protein